MNKDPILDFIERRFSNDCNWLNGNCYFFAKILESVFFGEILYDAIDGHFLFMDSNAHKLYDYSGEVVLPEKQMDALVVWDDYYSIDPLHYMRIVNDCII